MAEQSPVTQGVFSVSHGRQNARIVAVWRRDLQRLRHASGKQPIDTAAKDSYFPVVTPREYRSQVFVVVSADHLILATAIENFRRMFMGERSHATAQEFANVQRLIGERIVEHFAYEDNTVFPALLVDCPNPETAQLIAQLVQEHARLVQQARHISARLERTNVAKCTGELWKATLDFLTALTKHNANEEELMRQLEPKTHPR